MMNDALHTFHLLTFGCKVNQYESDLLRGQCMEAGLAETRDAAMADIVIVNTCGVTATAVGKSRRAVRALRRANSRGVVIATGCAVDLDRADFEMEGVRIAPQARKADLLAGVIPGVPAPKLPECRRTRALLKVQDGCNRFCAYCVVPHVRSRMWSKPFEEAIAEARYLVSRGHREIVVTGVRLGLYDGGRGKSLPDLLRALDGIDGLARVRFSSLEINEIDGGLLDAMARSRAFCRHLHLPLQSGDDEILRRMNRPYDSGEYLRRVRDIRCALGRVAITTDVIVGFPGETAWQFENTMRVCREAGFSKIHIFPFSARKPAPAAEMPGRVPAPEVRRRASALAALERELALEFRKTLLGEVVEVLVEGHDGGVVKGKTREYITVEFPGDASLLRNVVGVRVEEVRGMRVLGSIIETAKDSKCKSKTKSSALSKSPTSSC
jgi:threonylcarbamoyladenosine tRNA methylthiotransferase MtaB